MAVVGTCGACSTGTGDSGAERTRVEIAGVCPRVACRPAPPSPASPLCFSAAEVGADRRQLQTATRGQQPVPGQPHRQERRPERGGVRPGPVPAVEVLTQPAAIRGPGAPPSTRTPAQFGDHIIMFPKLSAKLYTSVFHHGLKVLSLKSSARRELCRRGNEPLGLETEGPSQGWRPLPPTVCLLLTPSRGAAQCWPDQVDKQQSCL